MNSGWVGHEWRANASPSIATARLRGNTLLLTEVQDVLLSLVDALRCPAEHEASSLVLSAEQWTEGRVSAGFLGCPVCHARYAIREGVADFAGGDPGLRAPSSGITIQSDGMRLAAQLNLNDSGGLVLLTAGYAARAPELEAIAHVTCLLVDAPFAIPASMQAVGIRLLDKIPFGDGSLHAAAVDVSRASVSFLMEVTRCVRDGGRLVSAADSPPPGNVRVIARDEREWVGEIEHLPSLVTPQGRVRR